MGASLPDARVDDAVQDVCHEVAGKHDGRREHCDACEKRRVAAQACGHGRLSQTGVRKDLLDEDRAAKNLRDGGKLQRDGGKREVAQAVAAHTGAEYQALHPDPALGGADFSADPSKCEGYLTEEKFFELHGSNAKEAWQRICDAADYAETRLLLYEGEPALCAYHAMSAGRTEDAGNVWQTSVPYLVPVDSEGDLEQEDCLVRTKFGTAQMRTLLTLAFPTAVLGEDPAGWIEVLERSESGYVTQVRVGGAEMHGQKLRTALSLRSTAFDFTYEGGIFSFETKGYGHGVGLSQVGANRLAQEGATAEEILLYYYPGTLLAEAK